MSVRSHNLKNHMSVFAKFPVHVICGRGSVVLRRQCDMLCTSCLVDGVMFSHNTAYVVYGKAYGRGMPGSGRQRRHARSFSTSAPPLSALPSADWHPLAASLAVYTMEFGGRPWRQTVHCARGRSLLSSIVLFNLFAAINAKFTNMLQRRHCRIA